MSDLLQSKLAGVRAKHSMVATGLGTTHALVFFIAWIAGTMILDRLCELPWWFRAALFVGGIAGVVWVLLQRSIIPIVQSPDDEELALKVEHEEPEFRTRLIAAIQFSQLQAVPAGASASLVRVMMQETESIAGPKDFNRVIKTDRLLKATMIAIGTVILAIGLFIWGGNRATNLLQRAFLSSTPLLTRTRVINETAANQVPQGDDFTIVARSDGYEPDNGSVEVQYTSGKYIKYNLEKVKDKAKTFSMTLGAVQEGFEYRIWLFDGHSDWNKVQVKARPTVKTIKCSVTFPEYTKVGTRDLQNGNYAMIAGSKLKITIESNKPLTTDIDAAKTTRVHRFAGEKDSLDFPMNITAGSRTTATVDMDVPEGTTAFSVNLLDDDGFTNKDATAYPIDIIPDTAPVVRVFKPDQKETLATAVADVAIVYSAEDDFFVGGVSLKYRVDEGAEVTVPLKITPGKVVSDTYGWQLSSVAPGAGKALLEGSTIEFWLEAVDTNNASKTGPGKGNSPKYLIHVVTMADKIQEMRAKNNELMFKLMGVKESQEGANQELESTLTGGAATQPKNP